MRDTPREAKFLKYNNCSTTFKTLINQATRFHNKLRKRPKWGLTREVDDPLARRLHSFDQGDVVLLDQEGGHQRLLQHNRLVVHIQIRVQLSQIVEQWNQHMKQLSHTTEKLISDCSYLGICEYGPVK